MNVFRIAPGRAGDHIGNNGAIGIRKSLNDGVTWGQIEVIDPSPWDDRNLAGLVRGNEFEVLYRQYNAAQRIGLGLWWTTTSSSGWLWEYGLLKMELAPPGKVVVAPGGICRLPGRGWLGLFYDSSSYTQSLIASDDGASWNFGAARQLPLDRGLCLTEGALASLGGDRLIAVFRSERRSLKYQVLTSSDAGATWSEPKKLAMQRYWMTAPHLLADPDGDFIYLLGGERIGPDGDEANAACSIVIHRSTASRLAEDAADWDYYGSVPRPWPSSLALYGYPVAVRRADGTHLVVFTERGRDDDGTERANFFQFVLEDAEGAEPSPVMSASFPSAGLAGRPFAVTGSLLNAGAAPMPGVLCLVQSRAAADQPWRTVARATTAEDGTWTATCRSAAVASWRVITSDLVSGYTCAYGPSLIAQGLELSAPVVAKPPRVKQAVTVSGRVTSPVRLTGPVRLLLQRRIGSRWATWKRMDARTAYLGSSGTRLACTVEFPKDGDWRLRFESPQNASHSASYSEFLPIYVEKPAKKPEKKPGEK